MGTRVKGYNIILKLNGKKVVGVTSNSFGIKPKIKESLIKDDLGNSQSENFGYTADFVISGLMVINATGEETTYMDVVDLRTATKEGTITPFVYGGFAAGAATESGNLIITDYKEDTDSENVGTYSVSASLTGAMTSGTYSAT
jgi:predicted RNA-binding protein associated with RNAse of E/G family